MRVGIIGTGLMGSPMALKLQTSGYQVTAYNRTPEKVKPLAEQGVKIASSPLEVLQSSDCTLLMLTNAEVIAEVILNPTTQSGLEGHTLIQMGTIAPTETKTLDQQIRQAGGNYLEAPVLGSIPEVKKGTLLVMVGASEADFQTWLPLLQTFGPEPLHLGPVGSAATVKLAMNQLIASLTTAFALSLHLIRQEGIDTEAFMQLVRQSALYAPTFDKKLQRMLDRQYSNPNFPVKHLLKDTRLFLQTARELGLDASLLEGIGKVLEKSGDRGHFDDDYSALFEGIIN
ncbi:NAD(P)-dependent oxidoreductase [Roseofilum capinflatum]|uniref:NAD(P)-dependent oxidoreductase n=1 Tax=Roseofilum capinflatum BLCC-M114 TaxID=3022440 RepID=A0ABT7BE64_9CYAN|nr:NAD(P)-dependent oxidoreductase [Roseofilum capinflatum]MDJ1176573.1 NAD(P)-dependent oxidoreductase [Roseofilum capinflatum BLCC-M114]